MRVTEIDTSTDTVTLRTSTGHSYDFYGVEDWAIDDICSCIMSDNGTETVEDDKILDTKYSGHYSVGIHSIKGKFEWLDGDDWYQFTSDDNTVYWTLTTDSIGFIPESEKSYTLMYHDNGTPDDIYDDVFITVKGENNKRAC
jgi:hypothetical protein